MGRKSGKKKSKAATGAVGVRRGGGLTIQSLDRGVIGETVDDFSLEKIDKGKAVTCSPIYTSEDEADRVFAPPSLSQMSLELGNRTGSG